MKNIVLVVLNAGLLGYFVYLWRKKNLLSYFDNGKWLLTWLSIAVITLMDELTSIFYAPGEAHRFIGVDAIFFIAFTSLIVRFLSSRMVEIAEVLELHGIKGGGVYSFSYLVLGPTVSFIAVASILVDYILTACISSVSAVQNGLSFLQIPHSVILIMEIAVVWFIALLNIMGIRENARFTFGIFIAAALVFTSLIFSGMIEMQPENWQVAAGSVTDFAGHFDSLNLADITHGFGFIIFGVASCILAYSGIESVIQTAGFVKSWKEIRKAYLFLALTVGLVTPIISVLVLSQKNIDFAAHEGDLITHYAGLLNGQWFGLVVGTLASFTLMMAVNTAFVASSELIERVVDRYGFHWVTKTNKRQSLYRIHLCSAAFYTLILLITAGEQAELADMYAIGLLASFVINMSALIVYRYSRGTSDTREYTTSRTGTLIVTIILFGCFTYLAFHKPYGTLMWAVTTAIFLFVGLRIARTRAPEITELKQTDSPMDLVIYFAEAPETSTLNVHFRRPQEHATLDATAAYVSFYSPRAGIPARMGDNHFRFPIVGETLYSKMLEVIQLLKYEYPGRKFRFHFGWPVSSWFDRMSIGVMVYSIMKLPKLFPQFDFVIEYGGRTPVLPPDSPTP